MILDINNKANKTNSHETKTSIKVKPFSVNFFFLGILYSPRHGGINFDAKRSNCAKAFTVKVSLNGGAILAQLLFTPKKWKCKQLFTLLTGRTGAVIFGKPFSHNAFGEESPQDPDLASFMMGGRAGGLK